MRWQTWAGLAFVGHVAAAGCTPAKNGPAPEPGPTTAPASTTTAVTAAASATAAPDDGPVSLQQGSLPLEPFHAKLRRQCMKSKHAPSCTLLAVRMSLNNEHAKAVPLYKAAGEGKDVVGWYELGTILLQGRHVPKDTKRGNELYAKVRGMVELACNEQEDPRACRTLGKMYLAGHIVERDVEKALEYFRKACNKDDAYGCHRVARYYQEPGGPVMVNPASALSYNEKACGLELGAACDAVATTHKAGLAGTMDLVKARRFYELACRYGFERSCKTVNTLPKEASPTEPATEAAPPP